METERLTDHLLNPPQVEAVTYLDGPLLVLAGAGTGKTRVLISRIAHIVRHNHAHLSQILSVTFTNKAAAEMRHRLEETLRHPAEGLWLGTFHSLCVRILRRHGERVGLQNNFTILDSDDQLRLVKQLMKAMGVDEGSLPPRVAAARLSRLKDQALLPDRAHIALNAKDPNRAMIIALYEAYQSRLGTLNAIDFGDIILKCLTLFQTCPDVLAQYHRQFRYVLVDEYQDTNVAQYLWLRLLAMGDQINLCCVGDDDQSIYGWRGAEVTNILRFEKDFPGAKVIRLEQNYRSTGHILAAASHLITHNESRLGKTLWTSEHSGEKVVIRHVWDGTDEARFVGDEIESLQRRGDSLDSVAILVRASFQTREFEDRLMTLGLPYKVVGGMRFYERQEIRDGLAYLRLIAQSDDSLAFERIINVPKRGLGVATLQLLHETARRHQISMVRAVRLLLAEDGLKGATKKTLAAFMAQLDTWQTLKETTDPKTLLIRVLDESGYRQMWRDSKEPDSAGRLENLKELVSALSEFETLGAFLEHVSLVLDTAAQNTSDMINIMTLHSAKGLEFKTVFLVGWEEGIFPSQKSMMENGIAALEEERRLAYVGLTRAREKAIITHASSRRMHGKFLDNTLPSRFLSEIPDAHVTRYGQTGLSWDQHRDEMAYAPSSHGPYNGVQSGGAGSGSSSPSPAQRGDPSQNALKRGDRVFHDKFGYGKVQNASGDKADVIFDHSGFKKVMVNFIRRA